MKSLYSMFLTQAYQDCWDDYNRSVKLKNFPRWDYVILTASNDQQAEGFRRQIEVPARQAPAAPALPECAAPPWRTRRKTTPPAA